MNRIILAAALLALAAPATQALAADSQTVATGDLDLNTTRGVISLRSRVLHAADAVCAGDNADSCRAVTMEQMEPKIRATIALARERTRLAGETKTLAENEKR